MPSFERQLVHLYTLLPVTDHPKTRVSLILRLSQPADAEAWEEFCTIYLPVIFRIARKRGLQSADAHDFSQNVLVRVARSVKNWNPDTELGTFGGWLGTIARNLLVDFIRRDQKRHVTADNSSVQKLIDEAIDPFDANENCQALIDQQLKRQLFIWAAAKAEASVHTNTWQAFWRTAVQNESVDSVARELKMTAGAIYVARSRMIARIRNHIESAEVENNSISAVLPLEGLE
jgi:RNA polymerase sigma-70 factor (ECF subfamily)